MRGSLLRGVWRGTVLAAGQNLTVFHAAERGVCGCIRPAGICLDPRLNSWTSYKPVYMHGAICATKRHMLLLFKRILKKKNLLPILSDGILPVPVKWPKEHKHSCHWVRSTLLLKMLRKAEIPGGCRQAESNVFCLFWLRQPLTAQSSNQKLLSLRPWLPGNLPPLISMWFLFLFLFHQYSVTQSAPWPVLSPLRRAGFVPLYETSASMWSGKEIKHLGLGDLWP